MNTTTNTRGVSEAMVTHQAAAEALDSLDDYARMGTGVDAHGPRGMLERYIAQQAALSAKPAAPHFPDANALADWLESLHECHTDGAVGNRKWEVAQIAAKAVRGAVQPAERVPDGEVRLWDTQWMNIVNHDNCYRDWDKADAINHAVKMTEQAIARNVADGKLPSARITASPAPSEGGKGVEAVSHYVPPKPCTCLTLKQREYCADRHVCSSVVTQSSTGAAR